MKIKPFFVLAAMQSALLLTPPLLHAQTQQQQQPQTTAPAAGAKVEQPWIYQARQLGRAEVDALLSEPKKLLVIDVRRPDELSKYGSLPVYLNIQIKSLPQALDYIPRDRTIVTVSNRAHRAGEAADFLTAHGFKVAGALGSEDYREAGGTIVKVAP